MINLLHKIKVQNKKYNFLTYISESGLSHIKTFTVKNNIACTDFPFDCASNVLKNRISHYDATVVKLCKEAGYYPIASTNMDEFAMGSFGKYSSYGEILNPWDTRRSAGGSSAGAAVSSALNIGDFSFGSDTGGSVRLPAAYCSVFGYKPSYGMFSRYGLVAFANSMEQIGILSSNINTIKNIATICSQIDVGNDMTCCTGMKNSKLIKRVSYIPIKYLKPYCENSVLREYSNTINILSSLKFSMISMTKSTSLNLISIMKDSVYCYLADSSVQAFSNLMRFNGIRYSRQNDGTFDDIVEYSRSLFGENVQRRFLISLHMLSSSTFYQKIQFTIQNMVQKVRYILSPYDALLTPTTGFIPPFINNLKIDVEEMCVSDMFLTFVNLAGYCAVSFPVNQMIGCQLVGDQNDASILNAIHEISKYIKKINYNEIRSI